MDFYYFSLAFAVVVLIYYKWKNDYRRIERWYFKTNRRMYYLLQACYFILLVAVILFARYFVYSCVAKWTANLKGERISQ
jgi:hypothetical protein